MYEIAVLVYIVTDDIIYGLNVKNFKFDLVIINHSPKYGGDPLT